MVMIYKPNDPFDLGYYPFTKVQELLNENEFLEFSSNSYKLLLEAFLKGEQHSVYHYAAVSKLIDDEFTKNFLVEMTIEEAEHGRIFTDILNNAYGTGDQFNASNQAWYENVDEPIVGSIAITLGLAYVIETKVIAILSTFANFTTNTDKKNLLNYILADEGPHTRNLSIAIEKLLANATLEERKQTTHHILKYIFDNKFVMYYTLKTKFSEELLNTIYKNSEWHDSYLEKVNRKLYNLIEILDKDMSFDEFVNRTTILN